jgi:hypothetical protein
MKRVKTFVSFKKAPSQTPIYSPSICLDGDAAAGIKRHILWIMIEGMPHYRSQVFKTPDSYSGESHFSSRLSDRLLRLKSLMVTLNSLRQMLEQNKKFEIM